MKNIVFFLLVILNCSFPVNAQSGVTKKKPTSKPLVVRQSSGFVTPEEFGAKVNDSQDDTESIQHAIDSGKNVTFANGQYLVKSLKGRSGLTLKGSGHTVLKATISGDVITLIGVSNVRIENLSIDGGGQTIDKFSGIRGVTGIRVNKSSQITLKSIYISKCGIINQENPQVDNGFSGMGISVRCDLGPVSNILIENVYVEDIAGGGMNGGDGIYIAGYNNDTSVVTKAVTIKKCFVKRVGRHCYTVAGGVGKYSMPTQVTILNCSGAQAGLSGVDIEDGRNVTIQNSTFINCGNYYNFYDSNVYGVTYRLRSGIATSNHSENIRLSGVTIYNCYYGISFQATRQLTVDNTKVGQSESSDIFQGGASGGTSMLISDSQFKTAKPCMQYYLPKGDAGLIVRNTSFSGEVLISSIKNGTYRNCTFGKGIKLVAGSKSIQSVNFENCTFKALSDHAVKSANISYLAQEISFIGCKFLGNGKFDGINIPYNGAIDWIISKSSFNKLANGIMVTNGNSKNVFNKIEDCRFSEVDNGINIIQGITKVSIKGNSFSSVRDWAIHISEQPDSQLINNIISGNTGGKLVNNGIRIDAKSEVIKSNQIINNNFKSARTKKYSISNNQPSTILKTNN
ncbi:MAG: right-handed parallel beta-helix repeat-containing protein [Janthinobacterium sp.]|jgi:hypothetical protein|uniref:Right handed beta helix domain-containing protein n=1 Tax=Dyadobacter pollutisoli TaxID=2910158 RepID=A0A9E8N8J7_9BACT|nr:right-handed parallel beta-helix repeat-containing protein [Dyadobacter pollutisoli]WAC11914.1 hypothetical protein ON006_29815 [Dyadobacter pollutisoli]